MLRILSPALMRRPDTADICGALTRMAQSREQSSFNHMIEALDRKSADRAKDGDLRKTRDLAKALPSLIKDRAFAEQGDFQIKLIQLELKLLHRVWQGGSKSNLEVVDEVVLHWMLPHIALGINSLDPILVQTSANLFAHLPVLCGIALINGDLERLELMLEEVPVLTLLAVREKRLPELQTFSANLINFLAIVGKPFAQETKLISTLFYRLGKVLPAIPAEDQVRDERLSRVCETYLALIRELIKFSVEFELPNTSIEFIQAEFGLAGKWHAFHAQALHDLYQLTLIMAQKDRHQAFTAVLSFWESLFKSSPLDKEIWRYLLVLFWKIHSDGANRVFASKVQTTVLRLLEYVLNGSSQEYRPRFIAISLAHAVHLWRNDSQLLSEYLERAKPLLQTWAITSNIKSYAAEYLSMPEYFSAAISEEDFERAWQALIQYLQA